MTDCLNYCLNLVKRNKVPVECKPCFELFIRIAIPIVQERFFSPVLFPHLLMCELCVLYDKFKYLFCFFKKNSTSFFISPKYFVPNKYCQAKVIKECNVLFYRYGTGREISEYSLYMFLFTSICNKWLLCEDQCIPRKRYIKDSEYKAYIKGVQNAIRPHY